MSEKTVGMKTVKDFLYALSSRDLIDHLDCWEDKDWEFAKRALKAAIDGYCLDG